MWLVYIQLMTTPAPERGEVGGLEAALPCRATAHLDQETVPLHQLDSISSPLPRSDPRTSGKTLGRLPCCGVMDDAESAEEQNEGDFLLACTYLKSTCLLALSPFSVS